MGGGGFLGGGLRNFRGEGVEKCSGGGVERFSRRVEKFPGGDKFSGAINFRVEVENFLGGVWNFFGRV